MRVTHNDALAETLLNELMKEIDENRKSMHPSVTDLIYCLTKSYYNTQEDRPGHSFKTKLYFLIGLGLERSLLTARKGQPTYGVFEGIHYHLDSIDEGLLELKSTRANPKKMEAGEFSESWLRQAKSYCKAVGVTEFDLAVVFIIQPEFTVYRIKFDQREIDDHWAWMKARQEVWETAVKTNEAPASFQYNEQWECRDCAYLLLCQTRNRLGS